MHDRLGRLDVPGYVIRLLIHDPKPIQANQKIHLLDESLHLNSIQDLV